MSNKVQKYKLTDLMSEAMGITYVLSAFAVQTQTAVIPIFVILRKTI
ncbi:hypothetical protein [Anaerotignum sp. MB30-C6]|nr:hypothetical protein [Anaerotignum sp. MB30-C6]WMI82444.1 hypothetical protein RBQ60_06840 [Anaerotignum sp. MB30-C6]